MIVHTALKKASKDERTTCLRELIKRRAAYAHETDRAEVYFRALIPKRYFARTARGERDQMRSVSI